MALDAGVPSTAWPERTLARQFTGPEVAEPPDGADHPRAYSTNDRRTGRNPLHN